MGGTIMAVSRSTTSSTSSKAENTGVPATQETDSSTQVAGPLPAFKPTPDAASTQENREPLVSDFSNPGDVNAPNAKPSTDHRTVKEFAEDLAKETAGRGGFHDSMTGRAVTKDGAFVDGTEGAVPPHRIVENDWSDSRVKLDPKSAPFVQAPAVTEDQVKDSGTVELSEETKQARKDERESEREDTSSTSK